MQTPTRILLALACTLPACGGGGGGSVDSGLPDDKRGSQLMPADGETICQANAEHLAGLISEDDAKNFTCVTAGLTVAALGDGSVATCQAAYDACLKEPVMEQPDPGTCALYFEISTCEATVGEIEACLTERNQETADAFASASCNDVGKPVTEPVAGPSCSKVKALCPGIA